MRLRPSRHDAPCLDRSRLITDPSSRPRSSTSGPIGVGSRLISFDPVSPVENAFIESFNGRRRDECLNLHSFMGMATRNSFSTAGATITITGVLMARSVI